MGYAEIISLPEVRARKQWDLLRQQLHSRFDQWLDGLEEQLPEPESTLAEVTEAVWNLRQDLTGGLSAHRVGCGAVAGGDRTAHRGGGSGKVAPSGGGVGDRRGVCPNTP